MTDDTAQPPELTWYRDQLERSQAEMETMAEIGKTMASTLDLQEVLEVVMEKTSWLLKPKAWSLLLVDEETDELYCEIAVSPAAERLKEMRLKKGEGIAGWVAQTGEPLLIEDVQQDGRFAVHIDHALNFTARSIACVPLKFRNSVVGVIQLINSLDELQFNDADLKRLGTIADYAAIAIENARNLRMVRQLVITDELTGLYNATHFHILLDAEVERTRRYGSPFSLVFLDLDHFKNINDTRGHLTGNRLLAEFGDTLRKNTRLSDMAARYGGDEFIIILPGTSRRGALFMVMNLRATLAKHPFMSDSGEMLAVTASYGIASFPEDAATKKELIQAANMAMYHVKEAGRNGVQVYRDLQGEG